MDFVLYHAADWLLKGGDLFSVTFLVTLKPVWGPFYLSSTCSFAYRHAKLEFQEKKWLIGVHWTENASQTKMSAPTFWVNPKNVKIQWWLTTFWWVQEHMHHKGLSGTTVLRLLELELPWALCFLKDPKMVESHSQFIRINSKVASLWWENGLVC